MTLHSYARINLTQKDWRKTYWLYISYSFEWNQLRNVYCSKWKQTPQDSNFKPVTATDCCNIAAHDTSRAKTHKALSHNSLGMCAQCSLVTKGRWSYFCRKPPTFLSPSPALPCQNYPPSSVCQHEAKSCPARLQHYGALWCFCSVVTPSCRVKHSWPCKLVGSNIYRW